MLNFEIRKKYFSILAKKISDVFATITGIPPLSLPNSKGKNLKSYNISGNVDESIIEYSDGTAIEGKPNLLRTLGRAEQAVSGSTSTKRILFGDKWAKLTANNNIATPTNVVIGEGSISFSASADGYGIGFPVKLKPNHSYTVYSDVTTSDTAVKMDLRISFYAADGTWLSWQYSNSAISGKVLKSFIVPSNADITVILCAKSTGTSANTPTLTFSNIMLVEGVYTTSNAPAYTPYKQLLTEINGVGDKTKNLLDESKTVINGLQERFSAYGDDAFTESYIPYILKPNTDYTIMYVAKCLYIPENEGVANSAFGLGLYSRGSLVKACWDLLTTIGERIICKTFTTPADISHLNLKAFTTRYRQGSSYVFSEAAFTEIMLVEGSYTSSTMPTYEPYGYKIPVLSAGKNLLNGTVIRNDYVSNRSHLTEGTYIFSCDVTNATKWRFVMNVYDENGNKIPSNVYNTTPSMYITASNVVKVSADTTLTTVKFSLHRPADVIFTIEGGDTSASTTVTNAQIEAGSERTEYEPYIQPTQNNIFINNALFKTGENADTVNYPQNKTIKAVGKYVFTGNETIELYDNSKGFRFAVSDMETGNCLDGFCNRFENFKNVTDNDVPRVFFGYNNNYVYFRRFSETATTAEDIKSTLADWYSLGKPLTIWYPLEEEVEEAITLPDIPTIRGNATIMIDVEVQPSSVTVEYAIEGA